MQMSEHDRTSSMLCKKPHSLQGQDVVQGVFHSSRQSQTQIWSVLQNTSNRCRACVIRFILSCVKTTLFIGDFMWLNGAGKYDAVSERRHLMRFESWTESSDGTGESGPLPSSSNDQLSDNIANNSVFPSQAHKPSYPSLLPATNCHHSLMEKTCL